MVIPDGIEQVRNEWFAGSGIDRVTVPASVCEIQVGVFRYCRSLAAVAFKRPRPGKGSLLRVICREAFYGCSSLRTIDLPNGLDEIGLRAFRESRLESITMPSSVRTIRQSAFCKCSSLKTVTLNEGLETLGTDEYAADGRPWYGVFQGSALVNVRLPSTMKRIEYYAFQNCKNLKKIVLPDKLEYVGQYCFWGSELQKVWIPRAEMEAGEEAFGGCPAEHSTLIWSGRIFQRHL